MTALSDRIAEVLNAHYGGWIDNGNTKKCHCPCGYRPALGESHGRHVAQQVAELFTEETRREEVDTGRWGDEHRWMSPWSEVQP